MDLIQRRQAAVMNQHYQRYSLDYFLDAQQRIGFTSIELWCGAQHFWLDDQHYDDVQSLLRKVQRRGLEVVSLTCPSFCFQYQYAPFSPEVADYCLSYFKKGLAVAEDLGCTVMTVNSGWGCMDRPRLMRATAAAGRGGGAAAYNAGAGVPASGRDRSCL